MTLKCRSLPQVAIYTSGLIVSKLVAEVTAVHGKEVVLQVLFDKVIILLQREEI